MADGELILKLDDDTARRLRAAADAAGLAVESYAADLISSGLAGEWADSLARLAEYDRTGDYMSLEEGAAYFRTKLEERLTNRK
jgi:plasmid stability protein